MNRTASLRPRPYLLENKIRHYAWGTKDEDAYIPRLLGIDPEPDRPYAELWIGAHPSAPSETVLDDGSRVALDQLISRYPQETLGRAVSERFSGKLPFLFKVLSTAEPLSIQAHPSKKQAQRLHARDPEHYPDDNHKPEIAVALDSLTALVGLKDLAGILKPLDKYPELADFIGRGVARDARTAYTTLLERSVTEKDGLSRSIDRLWERLNGSTAPLTEQERLFLDLRETYVGADVGLLSIFLLRPVHLRSGQGIFLEPGVPHAYLKGNIVECMANSDNVVRAGLTPKFKDVKTLIDILAHDSSPVAILGDASDAPEVVYETPAPEFRLSRWKLGPGEEKLRLTGDGPEVLLLTQGEILVGWGGDSYRSERAFLRGQAILIPAFLPSYVVTTTTPAELFRVSVPLV
jgi:mannose-6-phosphate isomerase